MPGKKGLMSNKTSSKIPKTKTEKERWVRARKIVAKESGAKSDKQMPWQLVTHIYNEEQKSNKTAKKSDVKKTKVSKAVRSYKKPDKK